MVEVIRLQPFLDAAIRGEALQSLLPQLITLKESAYIAEKIRGVSEDGAEATRLLHEVTTRMLIAIATENLDLAFEYARELRRVALGSDPFAGKTFLLAAQLAARHGDAEMFDHYEERYQQSISDDTFLPMLEALSIALASPYMSEIENQDTTGEQESLNATSPELSWLSQPTPTAFLPLSNAHQEPLTRTYIVWVRKLADPTTAAFAVHPATLGDLTDGGAYGREDRHGELYADLLLEFSTQALPVLESLDLDDLVLRLVFKASREYESFSVLDQTLFGLETSLEEQRLYFKLKVPPAWLAAEIPLHLVWTNLESCVLLSVTD